MDDAVVVVVLALLACSCLRNPNLSTGVAVPDSVSFSVLFLLILLYLKRLLTKIVMVIEHSKKTQIQDIH